MGDVALVRFPRPYVGIVKNALVDFLEPEEADMETFANGSAGNYRAVAYRWEGDDEETLACFRKIEAWAKEKNLPIIIVVEKPDAETARKATGLRNDRFLYPPLSPGEIRRVFRNALHPSEKKGAVDVELINPFVEATVEVLKTMAGIESSRKEILLKEDYHTFGDISGVIGILGEQMEGSMAITFSKNLAVKIVSAMLGIEPDQLEDGMLSDGIGEVVNMVVGRAKTLLASKGYKFEIALPTVIQGKGHEVGHQKGTPCLVIVFQAEEGEEFAVQVAVGGMV